MQSEEFLKVIDAAAKFANEMGAKLSSKAIDGKVGWDNPNWPIEDIKRQLIEHVEKGDFVDVANFAMFAWHKQQGGK